MYLSDIQIIPAHNDKGLRAFCSFSVNDQFYFGDIAIYKHSNGVDYRLVFPTRKLANGRQISIVCPLTREIGQFIHSKVIGKYLTMYEHTSG